MTVIPWFVVSLVSAIARPFGRTVYVTGTCGRPGADRIHLVRRPPDAPEVLKLRPHDGAPLTPA